MASTSLPTPPPRGHTIGDLSLGSPNAQPDNELITAIEMAISADRFEAQRVLDAIAATAQGCTGATGAALGMRKDGLIVCRARRGESAPDLGSRLSVDSGISGECLRTGRSLRCEDALLDARADREVCLRLGLRAIAAVPIRGAYGTMGILEVFSDVPDAFNEADMVLLTRLADLAEAARLRESAGAVQPKASQPATASVAAALVAQVRQSLPRGRRKLNLYLVASGVVLALLAGWMWLGGSKPSAVPVALATEPARPAPASSLPAPTDATLSWKPSPNVARQTSSRGVVPASRVETLPRAPEPPLPRQILQVSPASPPAVQDSDSAPTLTLAAVPPPASVVSAPVAMPEFARAVSQGVTGGTLQKRVQPTYPVDALPMHLEGPVIVQLRVSPSGKVDDVKLVSGHPILARAALDAIRQWRYNPFLLNGQPVAMETQVTITFKAP